MGEGARTLDVTTWEIGRPSVAKIVAHATAHRAPAVSKGSYGYWFVRHSDGTRPCVLLLGVQYGKAHDALSDTSLDGLLDSKADAYEFHPVSQDLDKVDIL